MPYNPTWTRAMHTGELVKHWSVHVVYKCVIV